jgi:hypothetical protein
MSNPATPIANNAMQMIPKDQWIAFLADFTRRNRGAHARLEVLGGDAGYQVETEDRPFDGVAADVKDAENTIWFSFGSTPSEHLAHGVHGAVKLYAIPASNSSGEVFAAEAGDGSKTVLYLSKPEDFALPPAR